MPRTRAFNEHDTYPLVHDLLRRSYPAKNGWGEIQKKVMFYDEYDNKNYELDFLVERRRSGKVQKVIAEVKKTDKVTWDNISQLNAYVRNQSGNYVKIYNKMLIIPSGANVSYVYDYYYDIDVRFLKTIKCKDDGIWWYYQ